MNDTLKYTAEVAVVTAAIAGAPSASIAGLATMGIGSKEYQNAARALALHIVDALTKEREHVADDAVREVARLATAAVEFATEPVF
jgi:hypothetical protein